MNKKELIFAQYKQCVGAAERVSERRQSANKFFVTTNSIVLSFMGYLLSADMETWLWLIVLAGLFLSSAWLRMIWSYKALNSAKFKIIHDIEEQLPFQIFKDEWALLNKGKYVQLTTTEQIFPIVFILIYVVILVVT